MAPDRERLLEVWLLDLAAGNAAKPGAPLGSTSSRVLRSSHSGPNGEPSNMTDTPCAARPMPQPTIGHTTHQKLGEVIQLISAMPAMTTV